MDGVAIPCQTEGGIISAGEVQWMTAGKGIIHNENVATRGKVRLLQLWLTLPKDRRWMAPGFQDVHADAIPVRREPGVTVRIYSGASGHLRSTTRNQVPVTIVELTMDAGASIEQELPVTYNGFAYVLSGAARIGADEQLVSADQVGWLDRPEGDGESRLRFTAGDEGARIVLYAGQPQGDPIVSHGPFIGDSKADIARLYTEFRAGGFPRMSELAHAR